MLAQLTARAVEVFLQGLQQLMLLLQQPAGIQQAGKRSRQYNEKNI